MVKDSIAKSYPPKGHLIEGAAGWKNPVACGGFLLGRILKKKEEWVKLKTDSFICQKRWRKWHYEFLQKKREQGNESIKNDVSIEIGGVGCFHGWMCNSTS